MNDSENKNFVQSGEVQQIKPCRTWAFELYPDSETYNTDEVLAKVASLGCKWYYILHNQDVDDDGNPKKPHYHVLLRYDGARSPNTIRNVCDLPDNHFLLSVSNFKDYEKYLTHETKASKHKHQYDVSEVITNDDTYVETVHPRNEVICISELLDIVSRTNRCDVTRLGIEIAKLNDSTLWSTYRRNYSFFRDYCIKELQRRDDERQAEADRHRLERLKSIQSKIAQCRENALKNSDFATADVMANRQSRVEKQSAQCKVDIINYTSEIQDDSSSVGGINTLSDWRQ